MMMCPTWMMWIWSVVGILLIVLLIVVIVKLLKNKDAQTKESAPAASGGMDRRQKGSNGDYSANAVVFLVRACRVAAPRQFSLNLQLE